MMIKDIETYPHTNILVQEPASGNEVERQVITHNYMRDDRVFIRQDFVNKYLRVRLKNILISYFADLCMGKVFRNLHGVSISHRSVMDYPPKKYRKRNTPMATINANMVRFLCLCKVILSMIEKISDSSRNCADHPN